MNHELQTLNPNAEPSSPRPKPMNLPRDAQPLPLTPRIPTPEP
jgi:hypothetical protein